MTRTFVYERPYMHEICIGLFGVKCSCGFEADFLRNERGILQFQEHVIKSSDVLIYNEGVNLDKDIYI